MKQFIITKDKTTALKLKNQGFNQISEIAGVWTFQNVTSNNFSFDKFDKSKIVFTNILSI